MHYCSLVGDSDTCMYICLFPCPIDHLYSVIQQRGICLNKYTIIYRSFFRGIILDNLDFNFTMYTFHLIKKIISSTFVRLIPIYRYVLICLASYRIISHKDVQGEQFNLFFKKKTLTMIVSPIPHPLWDIYILSLLKFWFHSIYPCQNMIINYWGFLCHTRDYFFNSLDQMIF